jgi:hypothetical protein
MAKAKGSHVLNAVKVLRANRERALAALPKQMHKYLEDRILPSSWYPLTDHLQLLRVLVGFMPVAPDPWIVLGRGNAQMDLSGLYRNHLRKGEPELTLRAMGAIWSSAHDSGEVGVVFEKPGHAILTLAKFDLPATEMCRIVTGYLIEVLNLTGVRDGQVTHDWCRSKSAAMPDCQWRLTWTPSGTSSGTVGPPSK